MEISVDEAIHIGDSPLEDYTGAKTAGLGAALIDRHDLFIDEPYRRISSLDQILTIVGG
jgi:FMN phosphatase YigB (HAD superfamily)